MLYKKVEKYMKKIVMICPRYVATISGVETYIEALMEYLCQQYEVHLITRKEKIIRHINEKIQIHFVEGFNSLDINIYTALSQLKNIIKKINPDLVHIHCCMSLFLYNSVILQEEYPVVVTMHSTPDGYSRLFGWFNDYETEKRFCRTLFSKSKIEALIFGSQYYMSQYLQVCPEMNNAKHVYVNRYFSNLPEVTFEQYKTEYLKRNNKEKKKIHILFPSRIIQRKGIEEALLILKKLPDSFVMDIPALSHSENVIYTNQVHKLIEKYGLTHRIFAPNQIIFGENMFDYYRKADIVLIPSIYEGFGIVAVEAMNCCVPVFTTCAGGLSEIIIDKYNGVKIDLNNIELAAKKIVDFISDTEICEKTILNAKRTVYEKFSKQRHMQCIDEIYGDIL